jgi:hypothetical protein
MTPELLPLQRLTNRSELKCGMIGETVFVRIISELRAGRPGWAARLDLDGTTSSRPEPRCGIHDIGI